MVDTIEGKGEIDHQDWDQYTEMFTPSACSASFLCSGNLNHFVLPFKGVWQHHQLCGSLWF